MGSKLKLKRQFKTQADKTQAESQEILEVLLFFLLLFLFVLVSFITRWNLVLKFFVKCNSKIFKFFYSIKVYSKEAKAIENICSNIKCDYPGSYCSVGASGEPKCVCETITCRSDNVKVCGEDGQTYASYCDLQKFSCDKQTQIRVRYTGHCSQGKKNKVDVFFWKSFFYEFKVFVCVCFQKLIQY